MRALELSSLRQLLVMIRVFFVRALKGQRLVQKADFENIKLQ